MNAPSAAPPGRAWLRSPWTASLALLALLGLFCVFTQWGRNYFVFARRSLLVWTTGRSLTLNARQSQAYDETYPVLLYLRENLPPDAVVLLPPESFIIGQVTGDPNSGNIPLLSSPSSVYNFIYPRVPVHWGDPSPWKDKVDYILVWHHWGLKAVDPQAVPGPDNDIALYPWPAGRRFPG